MGLYLAGEHVLGNWDFEVLELVLVLVAIIVFNHLIFHHALNLAGDYQHFGFLATIIWQRSDFKDSIRDIVWTSTSFRFSEERFTSIWTSSRFWI